jgi:predicted metal-dependent phosphoesterase TrpH
VDTSAIDARQRAGQPIGRPHLAAAVVDCPANAARLAREGLSEPTAFLVAYLIDGQPAFRGREIPTVADAIATIHDAGGVAIWAHPFWDVSEPQTVLDTIHRFHALGVDGVECFYVTHTQEQTELLAARCAELGLLSTGSSDYHGPDHRQFSHFRAHELYGLTPNLGPIARP